MRVGREMLRTLRVARQAGRRLQQQGSFHTKSRGVVAKNPEGWRVGQTADILELSWCKWNSSTCSFLCRPLPNYAHLPQPTESYLQLGHSLRARAQGFGDRPPIR